LFDFFTTQSPLFDGIDNDGNGALDLADPGEAYAVLHRVAGRINVNTAPASVLRSVPYMSLLPTSAEYLFHIATGGGTGPIPPAYSPFDTYFNASVPRPFWDFASAVVSRRESRDVAVRLVDPTVPLSPANPTQLRTVALAGMPSTSGPVIGTGSQFLNGPFTSVVELQRLTDRVDRSPTANPHLFSIDRFAPDSSQPVANQLRLPNHQYQSGDPTLGVASVLSPDYRFRRTAASDGIVDYAPVLPLNAPLPESGGLRARDIFVSRWANLLTVRSDVFTAYFALIDENGNYVQRGQVTLDRSPCFRESAPPGTGQPRTIHLPEVISRVVTNYADDTK
jgi:hypothetical protein